MSLPITERASPFSTTRVARQVVAPNSSKWLLLGASCLVVVQLMGGELGIIATVLSLPLVIWLVLRSKPAELGALLLLFLPSAGIERSVSTIAAVNSYPLRFVFPDASIQLVVLDVLVAVPLIAASVAFIRVVLDFMSVRSVFGKRKLRWLLVLYLLAFIPALIGAWQGQELGLSRWSLGVRSLLTFGGFFWGILLASRREQAGAILVGQIRACVLVGALLILVGALLGLINFMVYGLALPMTFAFWGDQKRLLGVILALAAAIGVVFGSLTIQGEVVLGLLFVLATFLRSASLRGFVLRAMTVVGIALIIFLPFLARERRVEIMVPSYYLERQNYFDYVEYKFLEDRGYLWSLALDQILAGPYLIVPSGRPLIGDFSFGNEWNFGAHNAWLETLRNDGIVVGGMGLTIALIAIFANLRVLQKITPNRWLKPMAIGVLVVSMMGLFSANFPMSEVAGFPLWVVAGIVAGLDHAES